MEALILTTMLFCAPTKVVDKSKEPWTRRDDRAMRSAEQGCREKFPEAPCLVKFIKVEEAIYSAVCGEARKSE